MDLLVMMLMVSSLADSILVRQELFEELAYYCLGKVIDRLCAGDLTVLVGSVTGLGKCKCWGHIPAWIVRDQTVLAISGMEKMMTIILDLLAMLEVVPNR